MLDRTRRLDVAQVIQGIPADVLRPLGRPGMINADILIWLTARGVSYCTGSEEDIELFLRSLRWMAFRERKFETGPGAETSALMVSSAQVARGLRIPKHKADAVRRLGAILMVEQWGWVHGGYEPGRNLELATCAASGTSAVSMTTWTPASGARMKVEPAIGR